MDQLPLFLDDRTLDRLWTECLGTADIDGADKTLREQRRLYPGQQGLSDREQGLAFLRTAMESPEPMRTARLADLVRTWQQEEALRGLHPDPRTVERTICAALGKCLAAGRTDPLPNGLLPAEVAARAGYTAVAWACVVASLVDLGENALLRQLQAWLLWHQERFGLAGDRMALALCHAAAACRVDLLFGDFATLFRRIRAKAASDAAAMREMAFQAWRKGVLPVVTNIPAYESFLLQHLAATCPAPETADACEQRFLSLLFLAEAGRHRGEPVGALLPWRETMQQLEPTRFREYMATIA